MFTNELPKEDYAREKAIIKLGYADTITIKGSTVTCTLAGSPITITAEQETAIAVEIG